MPTEHPTAPPRGIDPRQLSPKDALALVCEALGANHPDSRAESEWTSLIAQSIRRTCSVLGAASKRRIVDSVARVLRPLFHSDDLRQRINDAFDELVQQNEVLADDADASRKRTASYRLVGPRVVLHRSGIGVVQGEGPDGQSILPDDLREGLFWSGGARLMLVDEEAEAVLRTLGFFFQDFEVWVKQPEFSSPSDVLDNFRPTVTGPHDIAGLSVIDPSAKVSYYRGRWTELRTTYRGLMVGRRSWDYGDGLWCVVDVSDGKVVGHQDLHPSRLMTAADQAWLIQCAIDRLNGSPQVFSISRPAPNEYGGDLSIYSPVPSWITRRWTILGGRVDTRRRALASWRFGDSEALEIEAGHLRASLWMEPLTDDGAKLP